MKAIDITKEVCFGNPDDELLPVTKCACGAKFGRWAFVISVYEDDPHICKLCGRKLFFTNKVKVYEVIDE